VVPQYRDQGFCPFFCPSQSRHLWKRVRRRWTAEWRPTNGAHGPPGWCEGERRGCETGTSTPRDLEAASDRRSDHLCGQRLTEWEDGSRQGVDLCAEDEVHGGAGGRSDVGLDTH
jgi:hypothetical protein